jgi:hypothetical protein
LFNVAPDPATKVTCPAPICIAEHVHPTDNELSTVAVTGEADVNLITLSEGALLSLMVNVVPETVIWLSLKPLIGKLEIVSTPLTFLM